LIVQRDAGNVAATYPNTGVVAISRQGREILSTSEFDRPGKRPQGASFVRCEQIFTIPKSRLGGKLGRLRDEELRRVGDGLRLNLALEETH
jgi:mRNA-degrading endonuclease toxin of MazEF toxin-antitoxin module